MTKNLSELTHYQDIFTNDFQSNLSGSIRHLLSASQVKYISHFICDQSHLQGKTKQTNKRTKHLSRYENVAKWALPISGKH